MPSKRVTVFGGTGYLGRAVVRALVADGWAVRVAVRHPERVEGAAEAVAADVTDEASVVRALAGCSAAVNCVGLYLETRGLSFHDVHVLGAERVARLSAAAGLDCLVHVSGIGADAGSRSAYVRARADGEAAVRAAMPGAVIVRPSALFGPNDAFIGPLVRLLKVLPVFPLFGDGSTRMQPVHVEDVAAAVARILADRSFDGRVFELGGTVVAYRALLERIAARLGLRRRYLRIPFGLWWLLAACAAPLPRPPITPAQIALMERDNVVAPDAEGFAELGVQPRALEEELGSLIC